MLSDTTIFLVPVSFCVDYICMEDILSYVSCITRNVAIYLVDTNKDEKK